MAQLVKNPPVNLLPLQGKTRKGLIPGSRRSSGEGNGNPFQYSCLENLMDRGAWQAIVHGFTKSWTRLSTYACKQNFSSLNIILFPWKLWE